MIKRNQFLTQFIIFSLRNRQYRSIFKSYFIALDIADKFRVDQITAVDGDQGISGLFLQVGDAVFVRARPCFQDGVFRVPKNGMLETNKPLAMRVVGNALAYRKNLQCYNNAGSPTALQAEEVSIWI